MLGKEKMLETSIFYISHHVLKGPLSYKSLKVWFVVISLIQLKTLKSVFHRIENIVEKTDNAANLHILLLPQCFQKPSFSKFFPKQQNLDSSKLKEFANDNFKFDKNGRKFSKRVENTVGKGEIAHYEQFLLFPWCFQMTCTADT